MQQELKLSFPLKMVYRLGLLLPAGGFLPEKVWHQRHRFLLGLTWFHALLIALLGILLDYSWELSFRALFHDGTLLHTVAEGLIVAAFALLASRKGFSRTLRATLVGLGLITSSAVLVHLSGGYIELHFHFFVMLIFLAFYQDWVPFSVAILYVALHHGVVGVIWPNEVYNHPAAINAPWMWAGIHAFFILCASVGTVIAWRFNEKAYAQTKQILDSAGEGIYGLDLNGKATFVNPAAGKMLGYDIEELVGRNMHDVLHHSRAEGTPYPREECPIYAAFKDATVHRVTEEVFWRKDGTSFPVDFVSTPIFERGELTGAVVTFRDVTRRQQRYNALQESEERFRQITEGIKEVFWVTDPLKNEWLYVSPAYEEIWDRSPDDLGSLLQSWLGAIHPDDVGRVLAAAVTKQVIGKYDEEYRIIRPDSSIRWIRDRAFPVRNNLGKVYRITGIAEDITERKRAEEKLQARYKELETLHEMGQTILSSPDLQTILERILDQALSIVSLDIGNIRLFNPDGEQVQGAFRSYQDPENIHKHHTHSISSPSGILVHKVLASKKTIVIEDVSACDGLRTFKREGVQSAVVIAISTDKEILGVIEVGSRTPRNFQPDEVRLLEAIGNQTGIAVQKARLFQETERRAHEQEVLNAIAMATSKSLHRDELLAIALDKVLEVTGRERISIRLKDSVTGKVALAAHRGFSQEEVDDLLHRIPHQASDQVFASGQSLIVNDRPDFKDSHSLLSQSHSVAWIPIKAAAKVIGVLGTSATRPIPFVQREVDLLEAVGNVIGVALENARLFQETERRNRELQSLYTVTSTVTQSLDIDTLMQTALETTINVLGVDAGRLYVFDGKINALRLTAHWGISEAHVRGIGHYAPGEGVIGRIFAENRPFVFADVETDPDYQAMARGQLARGGYRSVAGLPITVKDSPIGVIYVYGRLPRNFTQEEMGLFSTIGGQIGVALENARLYEEARTREARLQETNRMLSALHSVAAAASRSLDLDRVLQAVIERITDIFGFDATRIHIYNEQADELALKATFEIDPDHFASARSFKRGEGIVGKVAESGKPLIFEDIETDPLYEQVSQIKVLPRFGYHFMTVFPIKSRIKSLGTLTCIGNAARKLSSSEVQLLEALTGQIAVAIENSELYENVRQKVHELQQKTTELERANQVKNEFLSVMSHELRTPLNVVVGYSEMIKDEVLGEVNSEQSFALGKVMGSARDLLTLIDSILQATRIEAGEVRAEPHRFALADLFDELRAAYDIPGGKPVTLSWDYPSDLPALENDKEKLRHILQNLVHNAIKFTASGSVAISARIREGHNGGSGTEKAIEFRVVDSGIGIPHEMLTVIFDKFRQVDSSETRHYGGVGLGLYIARNFTEILGGKIEVESEQGRGSTFIVSIPCAIAGSETPPDKEQQPQAVETQDFGAILPSAAKRSVSGDLG